MVKARHGEIPYARHGHGTGTTAPRASVGVPRPLGQARVARWGAKIVGEDCVWGRMTPVDGGRRAGGREEDSRGHDGSSPLLVGFLVPPRM